jgi:hypothetical protein
LLNIIKTVVIASQVASPIGPQRSLTPAANWPLVSLTPVANLPPVSTTLVKLVAKFATDVVDTGGNLPPVSFIPVVHLDLRISPRIFQKIETVLMGYSGAGGKLTDKKNQKQKIS